MISITAENTKNLPKTVSGKFQTWDKRGRAQAAAVKDIGPHAREGFEFETFKCDGRWTYRLTDGTRPENHAQLKANGGKKSILAQAVAIEAKGGIAPKEMLEKAFDEVAGQVVAKAALDHALNKNGVPKFLERAPETKEQQMARIKKYEKTDGPGRQIKNPPNVKDAKKRSVKGPAGPASRQRSDGLKAGSSGAILVDTVCRKEGATNEELCKAVGWKECLPAMKKYAAKAGVTITTKKEKGEPTRYFGTHKD